MLKDKTALTINKKTTLSILAIPHSITLTEEEKNDAIDRSFTPVMPIVEATTPKKGTRVSLRGKITKVSDIFSVSPEYR